jgi:ribonuclease-3
MRQKGRKEKDISFERLEFLGDRVLGVIISDLLYQKYPLDDEGNLSLRFSSLVCMETLYDICIHTGLHSYIRHDLPLHEKTEKNLLADSMEAFIAALYLDGGLEVARQFILQYFEPLLENKERTIKPSKTALQEWAHQQKIPSPVYKLISQVGPKHLPTFEVLLEIPETSYQVVAKGSSIKEAENLAAGLLLKMFIAK